MAKQRPRIPTRDATPLTDTPFAGLLGGSGNADSGPAPEAEPVAAAASGLVVTRTRKGGLPIALERRPGGRTVTILRQASGDLAGALAELKRRCGAGGALRDGALELQGDHVAEVEAYVREAATLRSGG
jgi:translation initiation factor 1